MLIRSLAWAKMYGWMNYKYISSMATKYSRLDAKDYARENMRGIWAAALNPFNEDLSVNEAGLRSNISRSTALLHSPLFLRYL